MLRHGHFSRSFQASFAAMEVVAAAAAQWLWRTSHSGQMNMSLHRYKKNIWISRSKNSQLNIA